MSSRIVLTAVFLTGLAGGWFGKTLLETYQQRAGAVLAPLAGSDQQTSANGDNVVAANSQEEQSSSSASNQTGVISSNPQGSQPQIQSQRIAEGSADISILDAFKKLINERQYFDAMTLFQEQKLLNEKVSIEMRVSLLDELEALIAARNNSDFSELAENYLSVYYDDIDALLLLAEFNQVNGTYLEVVNVFLLAKTYAYSFADQDKVDDRLNSYVMKIDSLYTTQKDWWSLINLYSHIDTSGLMTSTYQYREAFAYLRSGDEAFAVEKFEVLLNDSLVGEAAANALSSLTSTEETTTVANNSLWEGADSIALEKLGNQYAVNLENDRQDSVKLLIDTGASMTAVSSASFNSLNANGDAVQQDERVFRTANGLVNATVFSIPELRLGPHVLENTQVAVIDFESNPNIDGLLGMNILGQFRFQIDQEASQLLLSKK